MKSNDIFNETLLDITERNYFSTGFKQIDECIKSLDSGSIITIAARPAMGITSFSVSLVNHLLEKNKKIIYYSSSLKTNQLVKNFLLYKADINFSDIFDWSNTVNKHKIKLKNAIEFYNKKDLYIEDKTNLTVEEIEEKIKEIRPDVVFINYIQLLNISRKENCTKITDTVMTEIKRIAEEAGVIFVLLSSLSKDLELRENKRPILSDIKNSDLIEEFSDVILMIYRESYYNPDIDSDYKNVAEISCLKNNYGSLPFVFLEYKNGIFKEEN